MQKIINIITLGCSKNTVDSEKFAYLAAANGYKVIHNSQNKHFDIAIINTCGFINDAKIQSIDTIFDMVSLKLEKKIKKIVVFGCLSQRYANEFKKEIPEVDIFLGNYDPVTLIESLFDGNTNYNYHTVYDRIFESASHYAYLKIAEGCNRKCSFCAIPLIKGAYVSRSVNDIIEEAKYLSSVGVKELLLISQDLSYYGYDINKKLLLPELVEKLCEINGIEWIRLHYLYPFRFPERIIDIASGNSKVCKYFDIPIQHISDAVLKKMNRGGTKKQTYELIEKIRTKIPDAGLRTSIMVGHPGEGVKEFNELVKFIYDIKFDRLGVFKYSEEEGTKSAKLYKDNVSDKVKESRANKIMKIQSVISLDMNAQKNNKIFKVIVDEFDGIYYYGRTEYDSPEIDNEVVFTSDEQHNAGDFVNVLIDKFDEYTLYGKKI